MNDDKEQCISEAGRHGETVSIDLWYPRSDGAAKFIEVGLT